MIFDTHAHYNDERFDPDRDVLLASMADHGVGTIVNVSDTYASCEQVIALANQYPFLYAAVGIHPGEVAELNEEKLAHVKELLSQGKVVAVGEIGLDYHWDDVPRETQKRWLIRQLEMAKKVGLPVLIHSREAAAGTFDILKQYAGDLPVIMHCYSYSSEMAKEYVKMGYLIGVGGVVTFKNSKKLKETVAQIPLSSIVLETDCPYMAPTPHRGERNDSTYLPYVVEEIAGIQGVSYEEVVEKTEENARRFYQI